jgi:hypothetical protein
VHLIGMGVYAVLYGLVRAAAVFVAVVAFIGIHLPHANYTAAVALLAPLGFPVLKALARWPLVVAFVAFGVLYPALRPQVDEARDRGVTARATQRVNDWVESHLSGDQVALTFLESDDSRTFALVGHYADVPPRRYRFLPATNEGVAYANENGLDVRYVITAAPTDPSALTSSLGLAGSAVPIDAPGFVYRVAP